jgi:hypothetical protein
MEAAARVGSPTPMIETLRIASAGAAIHPSYLSFGEMGLALFLALVVVVVLLGVLIFLLLR